MSHTAAQDTASTWRRRLETRTAPPDAGDVISNMKLAPAVSAHKARRAADKNAIMTMVRGPLFPKEGEKAGIERGGKGEPSPLRHSRHS